MKIKKQKAQKKRVIEKKLKFQDYKNSLEASQIENKISHLEKNKIDVHSPKKVQEELIKNNKLILKTREKHNVFIEEINKIALSSNDDKIMQSIDSAVTYAYGMNKNLVCKKKN